MTVQELKSMFRKGKAEAFAWPGGYPIFYVTTDGAALCPSCVTKERAQILRSTQENSRNGWAIDGRDINWENAELFCDQCSKRIESAYAEDDASVNAANTLSRSALIDAAKETESLDD